MTFIYICVHRTVREFNNKDLVQKTTLIYFEKYLVEIY